MVQRVPLIETIRSKLMESPVAYRIARGAFWAVTGGVASRVLTMVSSIIMARLLGKEGYGEVGMVQSTIGVFGILSGYALGLTSTKYIAELRLKDPEKAGRISNLTMVFSFISGGLIMVICLVMSPWLAGKTMNRPELSSVLRAGGLYLFISTLAGVQSAILYGFEAFREIARINIWQGIIAPFVTIPCVWFYRVQGAIASLTINTALGLILFAIIVKEECKKYNMPCKYHSLIWREWPVLLKYTFPAMLTQLVALPVSWVTYVVLVNQPGGYGELGLFNAANQWRILIIYLPGLLTSAILPILSETYGREDQAEFRKALMLYLRATLVVALPLTVVVIILGKPLAILYGKQFIGVAPIITILMISFFLFAVGAAIGNIFAGSGRMWVSTFMNFGWAIVLIVSSLILIPQLGGLGLAIAYLISYLIHTLLVMGYVEFKIARLSILSQWPLILFSFGTLTLSLFIAIRETNCYVYCSFLVIVSMIPLIRMLHSKLFSCVPSQDLKVYRLR